MTPKIMIIAGEASADEHAAAVLQILQKRCPTLQAFGMGGKALEALGFEPLVKAADISVGGITEVFTAIPRLLQAMKMLRQACLQRQPQLVLLCDLPDFNLRLAKQLKTQQRALPIVYYISPKLWAWRSGRVRSIRRYIDEMLVIFPFEVDFYQKHQIKVRFVGNPLLQSLPSSPNVSHARDKLQLENQSATKIIALLPGSRQQEIRQLLPDMLKAFHLLNEQQQLKALIPVASTIASEQIESYLQKAQQQYGLQCQHIAILEDRCLEALQAADAAVVCSGTATLQAALLQCPMVVVYKLSWLTYWLLKYLVRIPFISLVNIIAQKKLVEELIQHRCSPKQIAKHLLLLFEKKPQEALQMAFKQLRQEFGEHQTAEEVVQVLWKYMQPLNQQANFAASPTLQTQKP